MTTMNNEDPADPSVHEPRVTDAPAEIWLVYGELEHDDTHANLYRDGDVTWCQHQIGASDVRYVRADAIDLYREQHGEALTTLQVATGKVRASAAALGLTIAEWEHKFGTRAAPPLYSQAALNEAAQVAADAERHACAIAVWMTKMDATADDADDKGVAGWLDEAEQRVKRRGVGGWK